MCTLIKCHIQPHNRPCLYVAVLVYVNEYCLPMFVTVMSCLLNGHKAVLHITII